MPLIPTNIITGFLGVGKTTAIRHVLDQQPAGARTAILVNEFGRVGIDGSLFAATSGQGVFVREVPGGCMCCTAGLSMQVALAMLIRIAQPDRLLIEPTGLGHPMEVVEVLQSRMYADVLDLRATLALIDARRSRSERFRTHDTFRQQVHVADVLVANKQDLCTDADNAALRDWLANEGCSDKPLHAVRHGVIDPVWLDAPMRAWPASPDSRDSTWPDAEPATESSMPACGYYRRDHRDEGYEASGWVFQPRFVFDRYAVSSLLLGLDVERAKGVVITSDGVFGYSLVDGTLTTMELDDALDSRIEVVGTSRAAWRDLERRLLDAAQHP